MVPLSGWSAPVSRRSRVVLPAPLGADDAQPVAAQNPHRQVVHDLLAVEGSGDVLGDCDELAGQVGLAGDEAERGVAAAGLAALLAQGVQVAQAADVALAAGGDAVAEPIFLAGNLAA